MKKVLILGSNGFIGNHLFDYLSKNNIYSVIGLNRKQLDLLNTDDVNIFFEQNIVYDIVIYAVSTGGNRNKSDDYETIFNNIKMFENVSANNDKYKKMLLLSSGAVFSRKDGINEQKYYSKNIAQDEYGFSKCIVEKLAYRFENIHILRIFNCFDKTEIDTKVIKSWLLNYKNGNKIIINKNLFYDLMHIDDITEIILFFINNGIEDKSVNLVYEKKFTLKEIAEFINNLDDKKVEIIIKDEDITKNYTGSYDLKKYEKKGLVISNLKNRICQYYKAISDVEIVLGTAQLGFNYGITNKTGKPTKEESIDIIKYAIENKIYKFDTARLYGDSEMLLNIIRKTYNNIKITTKIGFNDKNNIGAEFLKSLNVLDVNCFDSLLLHNYKYYEDKEVWNELLYKKRQKQVHNLGVSIYNIEELKVLLDDETVNEIQLPFNILDTRLLNADLIKKIKLRSDKKIYFRSIFLQGILVNSYKLWPELEEVDTRIYFDKLIRLMKSFGFNSQLELCLSFIKSIEWLDGFLIGVEKKYQLKEIVDVYKRVRNLTSNEIEIIKREFLNVPNKLLNPSFWKNHL